MHRTLVHWSGSAVTGPGISTFYTLGAPATLVNGLQTLFGVLKGFYPTTCTTNVDTSGVDIDSNTGAIVGTWTGGSAFGNVGGGAGAFAKGVGARIVWDTAGFTHNRHVRGSTYIVPLLGSAFDGDGSISDTNRGTMNTAINTFLATMGTSLVVWTRPRATTSGVEHSVTSGALSDSTTWLRSRRT
jgi:hypothetical protein